MILRSGADLKIMRKWLRREMPQTHEIAGRRRVVFYRLSDEARFGVTFLADIEPMSATRH